MIQQPDKYCYYNEDPKLTHYRIEIDYVRRRSYEVNNTEFFTPDFSKIDGYGYPEKEQYFRVPQTPKRLTDLIDKIANSILKDKSLKYTQQLHIYKLRQYLKDNKREYKEEIRFIKTQWYYLLFGYWFWNCGKPTWITGWHYSYLTQHDLGDVGLPEYRDIDRRNFIHKYFCYTTTLSPHIIDESLVFDDDGYPVWIDRGVRTFYGVIAPKARRTGETHQCICVETDIITRRRGSAVIGGIIGFNGGSAGEQYRTKLLPAFKKRPFYTQPIWDGADSAGLRFVSPTYIQGNDDLESSIDYATTSDRLYYDSKKAYALLFEEEGKTRETDIYHGWQNVIKPTMAQGAGSGIHGMALHPSTVRELNLEGGLKYKELCEASKIDNIDPASGQTMSGLLLNFNSSIDGLEYYIDKYGYGVIKKPTQEQKDYIKKEVGSEEFILSKRKKLLEDKTIQGSVNYMGFLREYPIYYDECFIIDGGDIGFNTIKIQERLFELEKEKPPKRVNFYSIGGTVEMREEVNGRWEIYQTPTAEFTNKFIKDRVWNNITGEYIYAYKPQNPRFINCGDTYKWDNRSELKIRKEKKSSKLSDGGGCMLRMRDYSIDSVDKPIDQWETYTFWASYSYRHPDVKDYAADMLNACIYWGAYMYPEMENPYLAEYFINNGYAGYLLHTIDESTGRLRDKPGYFAKRDKQKIFTLIGSYIETRIGKERSARFLQDCSSIRGIDDMRYYDLFTSFGGALLAHESLHIQVLNNQNKPSRKFKIGQIYHKYNIK